MHLVNQRDAVRVNGCEDRVEMLRMVQTTCDYWLTVATVAIQGERAVRSLLSARKGGALRA